MPLHECDNCTHEPEPIAVDTGPPKAVVETAVDADVEIARIGADRDVTVARIEHKSLEEANAVRIAELEAQLLALTAPPVAPAAEEEPPAAVMVEAPAPAEPAHEDPELPEREHPNPAEHSAKHSGYGSKSWFSNA